MDKNGNGISYVALEIGMGEEIRSIGKIWIRSRFNDLQIVWILESISYILVCILSGFGGM